MDRKFQSIFVYVMLIHQMNVYAGLGIFHANTKTYVMKENLIGYRYGNLVVVGENDWSKRRKVLAKCDCDGNIKEYFAQSLKNGATKSCGCLKIKLLNNRLENVIGNKYGRITVIEEVERDKYNHRKVMGQCSCDGNIKEYFLCSLRKLSTFSCGCYHKEILKGKELVIGNKYGRLTVTEEVDMINNDRRVIAKCECGNIKEYFLCSLKSGRTKSCGCYRIDCFPLWTFDKQKYQEKHPFFCEVEEIRDCEYEPGIEVRCKKCGEWFKPTSRQLRGRIVAIEKQMGIAENNLYCSDKCKNSCSSFRVSSDPFKSNQTGPSDYELKIWRGEVLKQQLKEYGHNFCEYCGDKDKLHSHHAIPKKIHQIFSLDPDNGIVACERCHYEYAHAGDCGINKIVKRCKEAQQTNESNV